MLRRVAVACYQSMNVAAKGALARMTQVSFSLLKHQHHVPAVQFLTIPLQENCNNSLRRGRQLRNFASLAQSQSGTSSSFREDYDEWYSHGRVGHVTSEAMDDETDFSTFDTTSNALHRGFLLEDLKRDASLQSHTVNASVAGDAMELTMKECEDDFVEDIDFADDEDQVLDEV